MHAFRGMLWEELRWRRRVLLPLLSYEESRVAMFSVTETDVTECALLTRQKNVGENFVCLHKRPAQSAEFKGDLPTKREVIE